MEKSSERCLLAEDNSQSDDDSYTLHLRRRQYKRNGPLKASVALNAVLLMLLATVGFKYHVDQRSSVCQDVYSPAREAIEYHTTVFRAGLHGDMTEYQGSSEVVLQNWEALYNDIGMTQISEAEAKKLPNATTRLHGTSDYVVQLDVFHNLHCLNLLRKKLYPDVYPPDTSEDAIYHLEHCVESLRQSLQCASDVSTLYWEWSTKQQKMMGNLRTTHTCRNFSKIQDWARQHTVTAEIDWLQYVPDAPRREE